MDFEVEAGSRVALVGVSGAGKTTVTGLVARLYDPQEGRVLVDGQDIKGFTLKSLAGLHHLRAPGADALPGDGGGEHRLRQAGRDAGGDRASRRARRGRRRSSGSCPRATTRCSPSAVRASRAGSASASPSRGRCCGSTPILILDEPQSGLDAEAADAVEESWRALTEGRTTFVIAHELRLVRSVDQILVIDDGRVAEAGSHEELARRGRPLREALRPARTRPRTALVNLGGP